LKISITQMSEQCYFYTFLITFVFVIPMPSYLFSLLVLEHCLQLQKAFSIRDADYTVSTKYKACFLLFVTVALMSPVIFQR